MGRPHADLGAVNASLYDRLGGAAAVAAVVDDAVDRHAANPALAPLFCGKDRPPARRSRLAEPPVSRERIKNAGRMACNPAGPMVDLPAPRREST